MNLRTPIRNRPFYTILLYLEEIAICALYHHDSRGVLKGLNTSFAAATLRDPPDTNQMTSAFFLCMRKLPPDDAYSKHLPDDPGNKKLLYSINYYKQ
jgi:hypothetical protein